MPTWKKLSHAEICARVFSALDKNFNFKEQQPLGLPGSHLDDKVFYNNPLILKDAPFLSTLIRNPNHIGCHTLGDSEPFFAGTQEIEREGLAICAEDILKADPDSYDGYIAAGGTEANIQAIWIYRNYFMQEFGAKTSEICILTSTDAHYSMNKAANLLQIDMLQVSVNNHSRNIEKEDLENTVFAAINSGKKHFIVVANMMTTMFGSVDSPNLYAQVLKQKGIQYKIHLDGAYGGFIFPFINDDDEFTFANPEVNSITLDAHKMVQAPYGTGIFLIRKNWMKYVFTDQAQYVAGLDATLSGSRSGANAVSVWMILQTYGPHGWHEKIHMLSYRADWLDRKLVELGVEFYRYPKSNILTIREKHITPALAKKYGLVPDSHGEKPEWFKIVIMDHVTVDALEPFVEELKSIDKR